MSERVKRRWLASPRMASPRMALAGMALAGICLLAGCADRSGCPPDLVAFGREEGESGRVASLPAARCELDAAERDRYYAARADGLGRYCDAQRAFDEGLAGSTLDGTACPLDRRTDFQSANETGRQLRDKGAAHERLLAQAREVEQRAAAAADEAAAGLRAEAAALRMDARQQENDLEALRGLAIVEGWMPAPAVPESPTPPAVDD